MTVISEEPVTYETLRELAGLTADPMVSVFHPTVRATFQKQQNRNRLKTLLARAEPLLAGRGLHHAEIDDLLAAPRHLIHNEGFWRERRDGLAVYAARDFLRVYAVPFDVPELVEVSDAPCLRPLLPAVTGSDLFYLLAISRNRVRLFRGTRESLQELDSSSLGVPLSLDDELRFDDFERQIQSHATGRATLQTHSQAETRSGRHVWHGHGGGEEQTKEQVTRYFRSVDDGVSKKLVAQHAPLILAAVPSEQSVYRGVSKYPHIATRGLDGNFDRSSPRDLHAAALPIARQELEAPVMKAVSAYREAASAGGASDDLAEILRAAQDGRVAVLLVRKGTDVWGTHDRDRGAVEIHGIREPSDADLLDIAVRKTMVRGGRALVVEPGLMPSERSLVAVYRY